MGSEFTMTVRGKNARPSLTLVTKLKSVKAHLGYSSLRNRAKSRFSTKPEVLKDMPTLQMQVPALLLPSECATLYSSWTCNMSEIMASILRRLSILGY